MDLLYPLIEYYLESNLTPPPAYPVAAEDIPEPQRSLLVHNRDMTPTLEAACGRPVTLRVLNYSLDGDVFRRRIVLYPANGDTALVFGAITIFLARFAPHARDLILERRLPFGTILASEGISHFGQPDAYFAVESDDMINTALGLAARQRLFGRRNVLSRSSGEPLAHVLEILPPADGRPGFRLE